MSSPAADGARLPARLLAAALACAAPGAWAQAPQGRTATITLDAGAASRDDTFAPELFGVSWNWLESGGGLVENGELVRDRSFRNQDEAMKRAWVESPNKDGGGRIEHVASGGDERPWSGRGYAGYMKLAQSSQGYTCVSQRAIDVAEPGNEYEVHVSARRQSGGPGLAAFLADASFAPIEPVDKLAAVASAAWTDYRFVLQPKKRETGPFLRVCMVNTGEVQIDEIRLRRVGAAPRVRPRAAQRIAELGIRSLRWPTGSDADHFDWREAIGPLAARGENPSAFGVYETPSLGLHEFLDYCEAAGIVPLVTLNVLLPPAANAELVEYVLGSAATPMGALRARNGRPAPWNVRHFELGNEPVEHYRGEFGKSETAKGYARLASATGAAMKAKAQSLGKAIELQAVAELTFTMADWIRLVPMLSSWNAAALDRSSALRKVADRFKGNFYSAFTWSSNERDLWEEVMGGGATIAASVKKLDREYGPLAPFWLTEYGVMIQKNRLLFGSDILLERAKDFQAGMGAADILVTAMQERFGGAYLFNLAQWGTWGIIGNPADLRLRPAGLAFSMLAPLAGEMRVSARVEGGAVVQLKSGKGNNPANIRYSTLAAVASRSADSIQVVILNRSYQADEKVWVDLGKVAPKSVEVFRLGPEKPTAGNEDVPDAVRIQRRAPRDADGFLVDAPARSLTRLVYSLR